MKKWLLLLPVIGFLFSSCDKDKEIIETVLISTVEVRNLPVAWDVVAFDMADDQVGFAVCLEDRDATWQTQIKVYRTENGGKTWTLEDFPITTCERVHGIAIQDIDNGGILVDNILYHLSSGIGWSTVNEGFWPLNVTAVGKSDDNILYFTVEKGMVPYSRLFKWPMNDPAYTELPEYYDNHIQVYKGFMFGNTMYLIDSDDNYIVNNQLSVDVTNSTSQEYTHYLSYWDYAFDLVVTDDDIYTCSVDGGISGTIEDYYNYHGMDYYGICDLKPGVLAVGERSISTNWSGEWKEVLTQDRTGFLETFLDVQTRNNRSIYVSGEKGVFYKLSF
ncbi:MAG: hypothetical protein EP305_03810 [Bacteroidetes bacterium]|nr:MAG: hypothetical protein EP305_03810 [Bacteroidota bacterium]